MDYNKIVKFIKDEFGIEPIEKTNCYIYPTFCHNEDWKTASHKLYLYKNEDTETPIFFCYTECGEAFNIYQLIQKYSELRGEKISFREAYKRFNGQEYRFEKESFEEKVTEPPRFEDPLEVELPAYSENTLQLFTAPTLTHPWALEGIDIPILKKFEISFSPMHGAVIIPHRDWRGNLVGVRMRNYDEVKLQYAKYMPFIGGGIYYRHPLSLNLYGLYFNAENIGKSKRIIIAESEKSVLQAQSMFENNQNNVVAICGSSLSSWQANMIVSHLGVEHVTIAFDKEYSNYEEQFNYFKKIEGMLKRISSIVEIDVLMDDDNIFALKESPFDRTAEDFYKLKRWRIK